MLVAAAQLSPVFLDREATVERAIGAIHEASGHGAQLIVFEIDVDKITRRRWQLDVGGHYSQPDVFRLLVNRETQGQMGMTDDAGGAFRQLPDPPSAPTR